MFDILSALENNKIKSASPRRGYLNDTNKDLSTLGKNIQTSNRKGKVESKGQLG